MRYAKLCVLLLSVIVVSCTRPEAVVNIKCFSGVQYYYVYNSYRTNSSLMAPVYDTDTKQIKLCTEE